MDKWEGKVALVTGASAGIGAQIVKDLVKHGMKVVGVARRLEKIQELEKELKNCKGELKAIRCDITSEEDIKNVFAWIENNWGAVNVLVNNAATLTLQPLSDCNTEAIKSMFDTNVIGLSIFARESVNSMKSHFTEGHIININSYVGHLIFGVKGMAPYCATKNAVTVLTESLRRELGANNQTIKVTSLSPGLVDTEMTGMVIPNGLPQLKPKDVSDTLIYCLSTPPGINITELTVMKVGDVIF
uniref:Putative dehydrogenase n=1 Tax=Triatoma infestans TaxID=30076 RepID=A0A023F997_TRIIF